MKLLANIYVVLVLETKDDQDKWENLKMSDKARLLKNLGIDDFDNVRVKYSPYNQTTNIVYIEHPRFTDVLHDEIEKARKNITVACSAVRASKTASPPEREENKEKNNHDHQKTRMDSLKMAITPQESKTGEKNVDAGDEMKQSDVPSDVVKEKKVKRVSRRKTGKVEDLGYGNIDNT